MSRTLPLLLLLLLLACGGAFGRAMDRGDLAAASGQWDAAATAYEEALKIDPEDEDAQAKLANAKRRQGQERVQKGNALLAANKPKEALEPFFEAMRIDPRNGDAQKGFETAKARVLELSRQALESGEHKRAYEFARALLLFEPAHQEARELEATAKKRIADAAAARGEALEKQGKLSLAVVDYGEALAFAADHAIAGPRATALKALLRQQVMYWVALQNFDGDRSSDDLGNDVDANVLSLGLDPSLPLRVVGKMPTAPKEQSWKLQGMRLGGQFRNYHHDRRSSRASRSCDYVCGKELVPNPEYATAETEMRSAQTALGQADGRVLSARAAVPSMERTRDSARSAADARRQDLARADQDLSSCRSSSGGQSGACSSEQQRRDRAQSDASRADDDLRRAESDVSNARNELTSAESDLSSRRSSADSTKRRFESTPARIEVDKHCTHTFQVETVSVSGDVECMLRGESLYDTTAVLTQPVTGQFARQDETFPGQAGVCAEVAKGDPLVLPSPAEVKKLVLASAIGKTQAEILGSFDRYRKAYLTRAREAEVDKRPEDAADLYVRYLFTKGGTSAGMELEAAANTVAKLRSVERSGVDLAVAP